ncbi:trace amine-associated receptor 4-like [Salarias fasciatus]|uniref:Trace amine-associated receptor 4-like n=1 Tax=Salarias fasciatus TaxID=181472 RepID=A0A672F6Q3_SALFA|nr:trace amine-associated receptor 4-like [Salarias fasciatus]
MERNVSFSWTDDGVEHKSCNGSKSNGQTGTSSYLLCIFVGSLSVLVTCGNLLVITSIMYFKQLHTPTNYLILSLAVADLLVGVFVLPLSTILAVSSCLYLRLLLCRIRSFFDLFLCTTSILNLCFISADRYYVVCQPLTYRSKMTARAVAIMIMVNWCVPALLTTMTVSQGSQSASNVACNLFNASKSTIIGVICTAFIPAIVIFSIYLKILTVALRQARSIKNTKSGAAASKSEGKATKTLAIVVGIYLMCWTPYFLCISLYPLIKNTVPVSLIEAFKWLGWSNSMFNPFVYGFFYKWFRSAFKIIISGKIFQGDFSNSKLS